ncbi:MAG TPA: prolyl oligopeptidase family serine peptidase [Pseudidiomarina sp.]|nr:prolyl oligopeptidase family serine peptidase [Pseudidiomarina sp.]
MKAFIVSSLLGMTLLLGSNATYSAELTRQYSCFAGPFESYEKWMGSFAKRSPNASPEQLERFTSMLQTKFPEEVFVKYQNNLDCSFFFYEYEEITVAGFIVSPKEASRFPTIIYNRGGNGNYGAMNFTQLFSDVFGLADRGFTIIGSQYRGAGNPKSPHQDEFGGADVYDVLALPSLFDDFPSIDPEKVGVMGYSRGAMQTMLALKDGLKAEAAVLVAGAYDLVKELEFRPEMERVFQHRIPNYESNKMELLQDRSALLWLDQLDQDTPFLIISGDQDERVDVQQSITLDKQLRSINFDSELVIFKGDGHTLYRHKEEMFDKVAAFFRQHL